MSFFTDLFSKKVEPDKLDIQGNILHEVDSSYIKKRKTLKEIIEKIEQDTHCIYYDRLDSYVKDDPAIFLEKLEVIPFPKLEKYIGKDKIRSLDLLSCIIIYKRYFENNRQSDHYYNKLEKFVLKVMEDISKRYGGINMPKEPYLSQMILYDFDITNIREAIKYCDINATYSEEGNILFFCKSNQFQPIYEIDYFCKDKLNISHTDKHGNNFIHHYIQTHNTILKNNYFLNHLNDFYDKGLDFNLLNKKRYNILSYALYYQNIEFAIEISKLNFIDFTITNDLINWFIILVRNNCNINDKITVLKNIHKLGKLDIKFLNIFFDLYYPITLYDNFYNNILNLIEQFILVFKEEQYKAFFEYADDNGMTIAHKLAKINHKKALRFIMEHTKIKFTANKLNEFPSDIYKKNKIETILENNNLQNNISLLQ